MSLWLKRLLGIGVVGLVLFGLFQLKSRRGDTATTAPRSLIDGPATSERAELREPNEVQRRPPREISQRSPVAQTVHPDKLAATTWRFSGVVVNERFEPVPHAEILTADDRVLGYSGADGHFDLKSTALPLGPEGTPILTARTETHSAWCVTELPFEPDAAVDGLVLVVLGTRDVHIRFVDALDQPVADVGLIASVADFAGAGQGRTRAIFEEQEVHSDADGKATLTNWPRLASTLSAWHDGFADSDLDFDAAYGEIKVNLGWRFIPFELAGTVRNERGTTVAGAALNCMFGPRGQSMTSDHNGRFTLSLYRRDDRSRQVERKARLVVTAVGHQPAVVDLSEFDVSSPVPLEIVLKDELTISGTVLGSDGEPLWGALVNLSRDLSGRTQSEFHRMGRRTFDRTDEAGKFEIGSLWPGDYRMFVSGDKGLWPTTVEVSAGMQDVTVRLSDERSDYAWFKVRALSVENGERFDRFTVRIHDNGATYQHLMEMSRTAVDGWVEMPPRRPGSFEVTVEALGCLACRMSMRPYGAGDHELVFHVERAGSLEVRVVDDRGFPLVGVEVTPSEGAQPEGANGISFAKREPLATGYDGRCFIPQVAHGQVELRLLNPADGTRRSATLIADPESTTEHVIRW